MSAHFMYRQRRQDYSPALRDVSRGRPKTIMVQTMRGPCTVRIDTHDRYFLAELKRLRQQMHDCHPDRRPFTLMYANGSSKIRKSRRAIKRDGIYSFLVAQTLLSRFAKREIKWYKQYGLLPPKHDVVYSVEPEVRGIQLSGEVETV